VRHLDEIKCRVEEGAIAAMSNICRHMIEELVDGSLPRRWIDRRRGRVVRIEIGGQPIDLIG